MKAYRIKEGFVLRSIKDEHIVVPIGQNIIDFNGLISLNETGKFIWEKLQEKTNHSLLVSALCEEYDIDKETAEGDIKSFLGLLEQQNLLCYE